MSSKLESVMQDAVMISPQISKLGHICVLMGGYSSEREISLKSGGAIFAALKACGCHVSGLDIKTKEERNIESLIRKSGIEVAFIALHGKLGEDGIIQTILEKIGVSYIGSGPQASRNALNKIMAQEIFKQNNIPVADFWIVDKTVKNDFTKFIKEFNDFPVVVKPSSEGSSIGITLVKEKKELKQALSLAFKYGPQVLIERYIKGREMTVGILDEKALPAIEIVPKRTFFDFTAKYQQGLTEYIVPAQLPQDLANLIQQVALSAHQALGCRHFSRVDIMLDGNNHPFVLEVNTIPGFTATSLLPKAAKVAGMNFAELCLKLISLANGKEK